MSRAAISLLALSLLVSFSIGDDDPLFRGKKLSEWIEQMQDPKGDLKSRNAGLVVMSLYGAKPRVVSSVVKILETDKEAEMRRSAARILGQFGPKDDVIKHTMHPLCDAVRKDDDEKVRESAINAIARLAPTRETPRAEYPNLHEMFRDTGVPMLVQALKDKSPAVRAVAAETVGKIGPDARDAFENLVLLLSDKDANCRRFAAFGLGRMDLGADVVVPKLAELLATETDVKVRLNATESLGLFGSSAKAAAEVIGRQLCKDDDRDVRWASAVAITRIGPGARDALPSLLEAVAKEKSKDVRCQTVKALGTIGREDPDKVMPALITRLREDPIVEVRLAAIEELSTIGKGNKDVVAALTVLTKDFRKDLSQAATEALKKFEE